jgi:cytochrome c-type biogenesis protein CcmH/NrfF
MRSQRWIALGLGLLVVAVAGAAQEDPNERERGLMGEPNGAVRSGEELAEATEALARRMRCPVCQGLSVAASSSPSALAMKAKAEALLAQGYDEEQVLTYFESSYGEFIRLEPRAEGYNLLVWILPALGLALGAVLIWRRLSSGANSGPLVAAEEDAELEAYRERVRQEVGL